MKLLTYAEYHRLMGEWFATGSVYSLPVRQVAHELLPAARCVTVRVYWLNGGNAEFVIPMTLAEPSLDNTHSPRAATLGGAQWTTITSKT